MRHQECFAVKAGTNGLLDVSRKTFLQSVEDIHMVGCERRNDFQIKKRKELYTHFASTLPTIQLILVNSI